MLARHGVEHQPGGLLAAFERRLARVEAELTLEHRRRSRSQHALVGSQPGDRGVEDRDALWIAAPVADGGSQADGSSPVQGDVVEVVGHAERGAKARVGVVGATGGGKGGAKVEQRLGSLVRAVRRQILGELVAGDRLVDVGGHHRRVASATRPPGGVARCARVGLGHEGPVTGDVEHGGVVC